MDQVWAALIETSHSMHYLHLQGLMPCIYSRKPTERLVVELVDD